MTNPASQHEAARIRLIRCEQLPKTGFFEVRFPDGRESRFFQWDDEPSRRIRLEMMTQDQALEKARGLARSEQAALDKKQFENPTR